MKFLPYILKHLRRNWVRTGSTILGMALCIFLFCTLRTVLEAMDDARELGSVSRLVTRHSVSLVYNLPLSYEPQIARVPGVKRVAISSWFGGSLPAKKESQDGGKKGNEGQPDFSKFFTNLAVEDEPYFAMHPEFAIPPDEMKAFREDMRGCLIGRGLARQFGWKVGDSF
jgi:putative ABC transport system permease protein